MFPRLQQLIQVLRSYDWFEVTVEMAVIWVCVYLIARFLQGTRGAGVIKGVAVLLVVMTLVIRVLAQASGAFARLDFIYANFLNLLAIMLIVVFHPELRQAMIRLGHARLPWGPRPHEDEMVDAINEAVAYLSKTQFGAIVAIERDIKLGGMVEGGQELDALVSARLLESIFWPNSPLHDLGVVIRGDRIVAAGVQFPLAEEGALSGKLGSRHRAAAGLSIETDCIVIVVSEETGGISIAEHGIFTHDISREAFRATLMERLATAPVAPSSPEESPDSPGSPGSPDSADATNPSSPPSEQDDPVETNAA